MKTTPQNSVPVAMTIATSDSSSGAGIQADLLTFAARRVYGLTAFAALTAQNPDSVRAIHELPAEFLRLQLEHNADYYTIGAVKTGMLFSEELIEVVVDFLNTKNYKLIVDPVMVASSGAKLLEDSAIQTLINKLLPQALLITPNLDEVEVLFGKKPTKEEDLLATAKILRDRYQTNILIKGGHLKSETLTDILVDKEDNHYTFHSKQITTTQTHGSGCTFSAAITAEIAKGWDLPEAVETAHAYLKKGINRPLRIGDKCFIAHFD